MGNFSHCLNEHESHITQTFEIIEYLSDLEGTQAAIDSESARIEFLCPFLTIIDAFLNILAFGSS